MLDRGAWSVMDICIAPSLMRGAPHDWNAAEARMAGHWNPHAMQPGSCARCPYNPRHWPSTSPNLRPPTHHPSSLVSPRENLSPISHQTHFKYFSSGEIFIHLLHPLPTLQKWRTKCRISCDAISTPSRPYTKKPRGLLGMSRSSVAPTAPSSLSSMGSVVDRAMWSSSTGGATGPMGADTKGVSKMVMTEVLCSAQQRMRSAISASTTSKVRIGSIVCVES